MTEVERLVDLTRCGGEQQLTVPQAIRRAYKAGMEARLTFEQLAEINLTRAGRWHPREGIKEWNVAEWSNAMAGEAGEACNATKKMRRIECSMQQADGDSPAPKSIEDAIKKIMKEVGDTVIYADLLCQRVGGTMEDAVRLAFNSVSEREGFPERI